MRLGAGGGLLCMLKGTYVCDARVRMAMEEGNVAGFSPLSPHDVASGAVGKGYEWREKGIIRSSPVRNVKHQNDRIEEASETCHGDGCIYGQIVHVSNFYVLRKHQSYPHLSW